MLGCMSLDMKDGVMEKPSKDEVISNVTNMITAKSGKLSDLGNRSMARRCFVVSFDSFGKYT